MNYVHKSDRMQGFVSYQTKTPVAKPTALKSSTKSLHKKYQKVLSSLRQRQVSGDGNLSHNDAEELLTRFKSR